MSFRIQSLHLKNYGNLPEFHCEKFTGLNLIIGENATGKTFLLKSLYSAVRAMEDYKRGDDIRPMVDILSDKLRWTFQADKLGDLVTRSAAEGLTFKMQSDQQDMALEYQFSQSAASKVGTAVAPAAQKPGNSIQIEKDQHGEQKTGHPGYRQVLVEVASGPLQVPLAQCDRDDGGGAGGQQNAHHKNKGSEGHGEIDRPQGDFSYSSGHKDPVHHSVERKDPHGDDGWDDELEKTLY